MPLPPDLLDGAREYRAASAITLLEAYYPLVQRMSAGLCGDPAAAAEVLRFIIPRALEALPRWRDELAADRWFYHHTVLAARRASQARPAIAEEALLAAADRRDPEYSAFVRTLRDLPPQQREAFVLHYGEHLNPRYLGVAMDCSADAASAHLRGATQSLLAMTGGDLEPLIAELSRAYARLGPQPAGVRPAVGRVVNRFLLRRRLHTWLARGTIALVAALLACLAWRWFR